MPEYVSVKMPEAMIADIDERVGEDGNRSQWVREAVVARMRDEDDGTFEEPESYTVEVDVLDT